MINLKSKINALQYSILLSLSIAFTTVLNKLFGAIVFSTTPFE